MRPWNRKRQLSVGELLSKHDNSGERRVTHDDVGEHTTHTPGRHRFRLSAFLRGAMQEMGAVAVRWAVRAMAGLL